VIDSATENKLLAQSLVFDPASIEE